MRTKLFIVVLLPLLVVALAGVSQAWQGRMGGAGDPYGLLQDESDFLIHPAKIANGEGIRFYGDYRFTYTGVTDWDVEVKRFSPAGVLQAYFPKETSGDEYRHDALLGAAFPLGPGRMGIIFTYAGMRGKYDGNVPEWYPPTPPIYYDTYTLTSDLDDFALRLLYGFPVGVFKLGAEVQFAYRQEENKALYNEDVGGGTRWLWENFYSAGIGDYHNLYLLMMPYDSSYWEALFKGSLEGKVGPLDLEFTLRGGFLFAGDNQYEYELQAPIGIPANRFDLKGDVTGWQIGGDLWLRYPLAKDLTLPFLVRVDYQKKTRNGEGPAELDLGGDTFEYTSQEKNLGITVGGGLDKELSNGAKIAAGIYYSYLQGDNTLCLLDFWNGGGGWWLYDSSDFPVYTENQIMLRLAGELALSPALTLRMGLTPFYGWVSQDLEYTFDALAPFTDQVSSDCYHWGIGASVGGTIRIPSIHITMEPFVNGGYQQLHIQGSGERVTLTGVLTNLYDVSTDRDEWNIGGGCSFQYDLP